MEPKKKSRQFYLVLILAIIMISTVVGVALFEFTSIKKIHEGPGPVYIDEVITGKPSYFQGENVNFTVTVNNPQDWPVRYPGYVGYLIEKDGFNIEEGGVNINYVLPNPMFSAHSIIAYNPPKLTWNQKIPVSNGTLLQVPPGNYTLTVTLIGPNYDSKGNCTFEIQTTPLNEGS